VANDIYPSVNTAITDSPIGFYIGMPPRWIPGEVVAVALLVFASKGNIGPAADKTRPKRCGGSTRSGRQSESARVQRQFRTLGANDKPGPWRGLAELALKSQRKVSIALGDAACRRHRDSAQATEQLTDPNAATETSPKIPAHACKGSAGTSFCFRAEMVQGFFAMVSLPDPLVTGWRRR